MVICRFISRLATPGIADALARFFMACIALTCVSFIFLVPVANATEAYIKLESETTNVFAGDAIIIDIEHAGLPEPPSLERIRETTNFERETYGTRIAVIKGKVVEINIRRMEFSASEPGTYLFGPLESDGVLSNTIAVKVLPADSSSWTASEQDAVISMSITPQDATVYQMLTLDIKLRHRFPIADENILLPQLKGFETRSLATARRTVSFNYMREVSWKILLFPQQSGPQTIDPVSWSGTLVRSRTERAAFERESEPLQLQIIPATATSSTAESEAARDSWWLPASNLRLSEEWSKDVRELTAGEEITRTITLQADGVTSGQLPQLQILESRAITQTLIDVQRQETVLAEGITSSAIFTYRVNAQSPIPVFLDTVRVPWWNVQTREIAQAVIPARRINIGLPERADLLSTLATENRNQSLLKRLFGSRDLWLLQHNNINRFSALLSVICGLLLTAIIFLCWQLLKNRQNKGALSARKFLLLQLAEEEEWDNLYVALNEHSIAQKNTDSKYSRINMIRNRVGDLAFREKNIHSKTAQKTQDLKTRQYQIVLAIENLRL